MLCFNPANDSSELSEKSEAEVPTPPPSRKSDKKRPLSPTNEASSREEALSSPGSNSSGPLSPASPRKPKEWDDKSLEPIQRVLMAIGDLDTTVLQELMPSEERVQALLNHCDKTDGESVLHVIARAGNNEALRILLSHQLLSDTHGHNARRAAFLNAANMLMESPLHTSLGSANFTTAQLIVSAGADPFLQNYNRETGFFLACYTGCKDLVSYILHSKDCTPTLVRAPSGDGLSALDIANARGQLAVVELLQAYLDEPKGK